MWLNVAAVPVQDQGLGLHPVRGELPTLSLPTTRSARGPRLEVILSIGASIEAATELAHSWKHGESLKADNSYGLCLASVHATVGLFVP